MGFIDYLVNLIKTVGASVVFVFAIIATGGLAVQGQTLAAITAGIIAFVAIAYASYIA